MTRLTASVVSVAALLVGCAPEAVLPAGASCSQRVDVSDDPTLQSALASATAGTCVVVAAGTYQQALVVPDGVTVAAQQGATVEITAGSPTAPAVTVGAHALLSGLTVRDAVSYGVFGRGDGAQLYQVTVEGALRVGVLFWCEEDCRVADVAQVTDCQLKDNAVGFYARGARVRVSGGSVTGSASSDLSSGYGVVASHGAVLEMDGTTVEGNAELGLLVDGAGDTEVALARLSVRDNLGRGLWAQGLRGTAATPKLRVTDSTFERNRLVGVGARDSLGISLTGGRIASTVTGPAASSTPGVLVMVGDGLGLFTNTGEVRAEQLTLESNQRSQALIDTAATGVVLASSLTVTSGSALGVVVQNTSVLVDAPMPFVPPPGQELPVSAPPLGLPSP